MTDYSRDRLGPQDEDRLPWLEPVEEELEEGGIVTGRLIIWLAVALLVVALAIGGFFWMRSGDKGGSGGGALIKAPDAYYKERPAAEAPATGDDEIVYSASKGNEVESQIDTKGGAETPVNVDHPPAAAPAPAAPTGLALPKLAYPLETLEPAISARTVDVHYNTHVKVCFIGLDPCSTAAPGSRARAQAVGDVRPRPTPPRPLPIPVPQAYNTKLNAALQSNPSLQGQSLATLVTNGTADTALPPAARKALRDQGERGWGWESRVDCVRAWGNVLGCAGATGTGAPPGLSWPHERAQAPRPPRPPTPPTPPPTPHPPTPKAAALPTTSSISAPSRRPTRRRRRPRWPPAWRRPLAAWTGLRKTSLPPRRACLGRAGHGWWPSPTAR